MSHQIFVSYSHRDAELVGPVVRLLRATNNWVFLDSDTIQPGKKWRTEINDALQRATLVVVFWCRHSDESSAVAQEYRAAVVAQKDVLPVLLDSTRLPPDLIEFQWIDFRDVIGERHDTDTGEVNLDPDEPSRRLPDVDILTKPRSYDDPPAGLPAKRKSLRRPAWLLLAAAAVVALFVTVVPGDIRRAVSLGMAALGVLALLTFGVLAFWRRLVKSPKETRGSYRETPSSQTPTRDSSIETPTERMVSRLNFEISRRLNRQVT